MKNLFLSVGVMKSGTTFLYNVLRQHPDIHFTPEKELHYFAHVYGLSPRLMKPFVCRGLDSWVPYQLQSEKLKGRILSTDFRRHRLASVMRGRYATLSNADSLRSIVSWYADRYLSDPIDEGWLDSVFDYSGEGYCADFSNYHSMLGRSGWEGIRRNVTGKLRVLLVLRDPMERLWSHFKFDAEQGQRADDITNFNHSAAERLLSNASIAPYSRYGDIVESLKDNLDPEELHIMYLERFLDEPGAGLKKLEEFLGIGIYDFAFNPNKKSNPSAAVGLASEFREVFAEYLLPQLEKLASIQDDVPRSYFDGLLKCS